MYNPHDSEEISRLMENFNYDESRRNEILSKYNRFFIKRVLYPGSFDPITKGHMNIVEQASTLFDEVVIAVLQNSLKQTCLFTLDERLEIIKELYKEKNNIKVVTGKSSISVALDNKCIAIVRGLRSLSDYNYEVQLQQLNKEISNNEVNTICLFADKEYQFVSSSMVKEILNLDKDISKYVDPVVEKKMLIKKRSLIK